MKISGIIFDLDGTLTDSMYIWDTVAVDYLHNRGLEPHENINEVFRTMSLLQSANYYREHYGITDDAEKIVSDINQMIADFYFNTALPKEAVIETLKEYKAKGIKMCIATATDRTLVEAALKRNNMLRFFSHIFTCYDLKCGKDTPFIFDTALAFLGTKKEETFVFEDSLHAIETAKGAGYKVVGVYDKSSDYQQEKIKKLSDIYINSFKELKGVFE